MSQKRQAKDTVLAEFMKWQVKDFLLTKQYWKLFLFPEIHSKLYIINARGQWTPSKIKQ